MARDRIEKQLGDVITLQRGFDLPIQNRKKGTVPIVSSSGVTGTHSQIGVRAPGVVTGRYGTIGQVFYIEKDFWPLNTTLYVKDFKGNDPRFISYLLQTIDYLSCSDKSSVPGVNRNDLHQITVAVPNISEQQTIARILETLDAKVALNCSINETLEAMARAIFKSWFVDFDPVRSKVAGRHPFGMDAETAALFPDSFDDSAIGEIPKGWNVGKIEELITLSRDTITPSDCSDELFEHYSIPAFDEGQRPKTEKGVEIKSNKFSVHGDAVLLSKLNPRIRRIWLPFISEERRSIASTEFLVVRPKTQYTREFLYFLFSSESFAEVFATLVTGTSGSHQRVKPEFLLSMHTVIPTKECILAFISKVKPVCALIEKQLDQSQTLAALRDLLLPKLISGEIHIKDAEKMVGEKA
jgi:type I restriction enzyme S subunit